MNEDKQRKMSLWIRTNLENIGKAIKAAQEAREDPNSPVTSGTDALKVAATVLNTLVDIPLLPEFVEQLIFETAITVVVELARAIWGKKDWFSQLMRELNL